MQCTSIVRHNNRNGYCVCQCLLYYAALHILQMQLIPQSVVNCLSAFACLLCKLREMIQYNISSDVWTSFSSEICLCEYYFLLGQCHKSLCVVFCPIHSEEVIRAASAYWASCTFPPSPGENNNCPYPAQQTMNSVFLLINASAPEIHSFIH